MNQKTLLTLSLILNVLLTFFILIIFFAPPSWFLPTDYILLNKSGSRVCKITKDMTEIYNQFTQEEKEEFDKFCNKFQK